MFQKFLYILGLSRRFAPQLSSAVTPADAAIVEHFLFEQNPDGIVISKKWRHHRLQRCYSTEIALWACGDYRQVAGDLRPGTAAERQFVVRRRVGKLRNRETRRLLTLRVHAPSAGRERISASTLLSLIRRARFDFNSLLSIVASSTRSSAVARKPKASTVLAFNARGDVRGWSRIAKPCGEH